LADVIERATLDPAATPPEAPAAANLRRAPSPPPSETEQPAASRAERRSLDALRADAQRTMVPANDRRGGADRRAGMARPRAFGGLNLKPSRILLLLVAVVAGGGAAFLATQHEAPQVVQAVTEKVIPETRTQILVAKQAIGMGERLSAASVEWQDWPQGAVRPEYITIAATPGAIADMTGDIARFEFFPGEPIRQQKLARAGQGYLSAVLDSGKRGVSVTVAAEAASGGFVVPNDHVDVVLTRVAAGGGQMSTTILDNVRVLAINTRLGETGATGAPADPANPRAEVFADHAIATLELDPSQADVIINAGAAGKLSLVLRALVDASVHGGPSDAAINQTIRMTSPFWAK
jgi:pilus assembly protein CpaB